MNDFLLASMILCLALSLWRGRNPGQSVEKDPAAEEQLAMLRTALDICQERAPTSAESRKVAEGLKAMLSQFRTSSDDATTTSITARSHSHSTGFTPQPDVMNLTPLSLNESPALQTGPDPNVNGDPGLFENLFDGAENIDWQFLDQYLVNAEQYDDDAAMNAMNGQDWQSTPYRFLGQSTPVKFPSQQKDVVSSYPFGEALLGPTGPMVSNGATQSVLAGRGGPENGYPPRY